METKFLINDIYNSSWFGSPLWDLYGNAAKKIESCYNRSIKILSGLPLATHRSLIEIITKKTHLKKILLKRFLMMISKLKQSEKPLVKTLLDVTLKNCRSTTGRNMRNILLESKYQDTNDLDPSIINEFSYHPLPVEDGWIGENVSELLAAKEAGNLDTDSLMWLNLICTD